MRRKCVEERGSDEFFTESIFLLSEDLKLTQDLCIFNNPFQYGQFCSQQIISQQGS